MYYHYIIWTVTVNLVFSHDLIGEFFTTGQELSSAGKSFELVNPKKKAKKKSYTNSGVVGTRLYLPLSY